MSTIIESIERSQLRKVPAFAPGDRVKVHFQVIEGSRKRTQVFEGIVIKRQGSGLRETFTVRKQSFGVGVERTFPVHSPKIEQIEVAARGEVRRAKLYYLRDRVGKRARVRERAWLGPNRDTMQQDVGESELPVEAEAPVDQAPASDATGEATSADAEEAKADEPAAAADAPQEQAAEPEADAKPVVDAPADGGDAENQSS